MSGSRNLTTDVDIDLKGLFGAIWRKKILIVLLTLIGGALIYVSASMISPRYKSDAQILIKKRESVFTRIPSNEPQQNGGEFDEQAVGSQVIVLKSDDLASRLIKKLDLENHPEFQKKASKPGLFDLAKSLITAPNPTADNSQAEPSRLVVNPGVLKQFKKQLTVYAAEKSRVAIVEFWSHDRALAEKVPNALADIYLEFTRNAKLESDRSATGFLAPEIDELRSKVKSAEEKVAEFRSNSDILLGNNNALLATQQLSEVSSELSRVRAERSSAEAKIDSIKAALSNGGSLDVVPEVISSPLIQRLRERQITIQGKISELSTTLLPNHPQIKALRSQLPALAQQIKKAASDILKSLENNVDLARKQENVLLQDVNRLKAESSRVGEAEVQLRALEREATAQRERLESYLGRFNEAESRQASGYVPSEARVIEHAVLPSESYFPKVLQFTLAGMTGVALLSIFGVLAGELLSGRAFKAVKPLTEEDMPERVLVENAPPLAPKTSDLLRDPEPAFAPVPHLANSNIANDSDVFGIRFAMQAVENLKRANVAVVSLDGEQGTSATIAIARYLAERGHSTIVTDFTGNGNTAKAMIGNGDVHGLGEVLSGMANLRDVLFADNASAAHVLASGNLISAQNELKRLPQVIDALANSYAFTVYDCGNAGIEGLSKIADADTIIIIPTNAGTLRESKSIEQNLKVAGFSETLLVQADGNSNSANLRNFNVSAA